MNGLSVFEKVPAYTALLAVPAVWGVAVQLGQILPYADCAHQSNHTAVVVFGTLIVAAAGCLLSWNAAVIAPNEARLQKFVGLVAVLTSLVLAFALSLQFLASSMLSACER